MRLGEEILREIEAVATAENAARVDFDRVTHDSRLVTPGSLFVAVRGASVDGHLFIEAATERGAVLVVCEEVPPGIRVPWVQVKDSRRALARLHALAFGDPSRQLTVVGITGTDGKTTTAMLVEAGFLGCNVPTGLIGTVEYRMPGLAQRASLTTPDPEMLHRLLSEMLQRGVKALAMEVSSHALDQRRVDYCAFSVAVFTNLGRDHLDYHKTPQAYAQAKLRFFKEVLPLSPNAKAAVVNDDDPFSREIRRCCSLPVVGFSAHENGADVFPVQARFTLDGTEAYLRSPWGEFFVKSPLIGEHNLMNLMAAVAVGGVLGLDMAKFVAGVAAVRVVPGRLERVFGRKPVKVFVDYAHTPKAIENVLKALRPLLGGKRLTVVFGAGGSRDKGKRPLMGYAACRLADTVIVTSDNPRDEDPMEIICDIMRGVERAKEEGALVDCLVEPDRRSAIAKAIALSREGDVVVIAGKGHEQEQIIGGKRLPFSDVEVAREWLNA